ncbi:NAD-dependent epimerase/dehydratase family protein [Bradyrhizobium diazoefficiens]|nr:NAD-dependent epimerase/dehydratase family protein [Bradyrhizobium diazoefficiens]MBR0965297.1 NAD-dependent epimerase/dehydratase family protein [Bradyrhizobium diazoefficiens]MBR0977694.1 NAD-dependent epimerase/dehydratase family protein [Bradyrhizobium diazoefficiens]MBR1007624.1 NAD-dependent epimerase/dehydratase family protein [Bradyrhizobium diazoefficiens]MBR1013759.1 NAD-dependent epimerase/dehydratase family protein [Bradyrhizobium diazoefficiens]MBR1050851.1 NAD-dependent epimer
MTGKKIVVAGATGLVGNASLRHFGTSDPTEVVALSRRKPRDLYGARHVSVDLTSDADCRRAAAELAGATHLIYAALYEAPQLVDGWRDPDQIRTNDLMLRNLMGALEPAAPDLQHVALLQGTKAYGVHVRPLTVPAREGRSEMYEQPNFYWVQENFLRELQVGKAWHWTILRPVLIVGLAMGGAMDLIPPLGVYAAMLREQGRPLHYPGGAARVSQAVDVDLLARAIAWSGEANSARNEAFNVTNGDVFSWENIWPAVADALEMKPGEPVPLSLAKQWPNWVGPWDALRRTHNLVSPGLADFVGLSFQYADYSLRYGHTESGQPSIVSTVKINRAGFTEMMDTEDMFRKWFRQAKDERLLP